MQGSAIHVISHDPALRRAVVARLERAAQLGEHPEGGVDFDGLGAGDIVITTPGDCPPETAHLAARAGAAVIILAPIPRPEEADRYRRAGVAAYLPMLIDGTDLVEAVRSALDRGLPSRNHCRAR
ncbi:hypothetical protein [Tepidiforma sp.]|uniref:hypothetical protein n=1 Tax=Tepidiforma sp. TaxID=2682230 RepID=UPI002ADE5231|nr:hypothetical protein [Tepidiforma sp.]